MAINIGSNYTLRFLTWNDWKTEQASRHGNVQFDEDEGKYDVWFYDQNDVFNTYVYKGTIPDTELALGRTQTDIDNYLSDFETNYKPSANRKISATQTDKASLVAIVGREGSETIWATHNFADPTTWYGESTRVTSETLSNSGDSLTFNSLHPNWIDLDHGKIFDEDALKEDVAHGYSITVRVDGIEKQMIEAFYETDLTAPGDYYVNYELGNVIFRTALSPGAVVTADYSYESGSVWVLKPTTDRALDIEQAEIQFSTDISFNDTIEFKIFGPIDVFAPHLLASLPSGYMIELEKTSYKTIYQMIDEALGSYPQIPAIGGAGGRGSSSPIYGFPFTYNAVRRLDSRYGLELRVGLKNNKKFGGSRATGTFYCVSRNIADL